MDIFLHPENWIALLTLTFLEIVLGIDNIIFISIVTNKLPVQSRRTTRNIGLFLAMLFRSLLLLTISFFIRLTNPLFTVFSLGNIHPRSGFDCWRTFSSAEKHFRDSYENGRRGTYASC